jgi:hypothetical protein
MPLSADVGPGPGGAGRSAKPRATRTHTHPQIQPAGRRRRAAAAAAARGGGGGWPLVRIQIPGASKQKFKDHPTKEQATQACAQQGKPPATAYQGLHGGKAKGGRLDRRHSARTQALAPVEQGARKSPEPLARTHAQTKTQRGQGVHPRSLETARIILYSRTSHAST